MLFKALRRAGATFEKGEPDNHSDGQSAAITKTDLYLWGLSGGADSAKRRAALLRSLDLPAHMSANALLAFINAVGTREEIKSVLQQFTKND